MDHLQKLRIAINQHVPYKKIKLIDRVDRQNANNSKEYFSNGQREEKYLLDLSIPSIYSSLNEYLDDVFDEYDFKNTRIICIDGTNGSGKSSTIKKTNRLYFKINSIFPLITNSSSYNYNSINSKRYITVKDILNYLPEAKEVGICWDRDRYSNLRWQYIHQLVHYYSSRGKIIPTDNEFEVFGVLNNFATRSNLCEILEYHENREDPELTLTFTCRDVLLLSMSLINRALSENTCVASSVITNDAYNAKEENYLVAQNYVYYWFAKLKGDPCIDISCVYKYFEGLTADEFQQCIVDRINYALKSADAELKEKPIDTLVKCTTDTTVPLMDSVKSDQFIQTLYNNANDTMIYKYSNK